MKSGSNKNTEIYYETQTNNQPNTKMKLKDLHKASIIYKEIMDLDDQIRKITRYAKRIAEITDKMQLIVSLKLDPKPVQEVGFFTQFGETMSIQFNSPVTKMHESDVLKIDIDQSDVLRILQIITTKKKEEKFYLFEQTKNL